MQFVLANADQFPGIDVELLVTKVIMEYFGGQEIVMTNVSLPDTSPTWAGPAKEGAASSRAHSQTYAALEARPQTDVAIAFGFGVEKIPAPGKIFHCYVLSVSVRKRGQSALSSSEATDFIPVIPVPSALLADAMTTHLVVLLDGLWNSISSEPGALR